MLACPLLLTTAIENMVKLLILHLCYTTRESWEKGCVEGRFFSAYFVILSGLVQLWFRSVTWTVPERMIKAAYLLMNKLILCKLSFLGTCKKQVVIFSRLACHVATQCRHLHNTRHLIIPCTKEFSNNRGCVDVFVSLRHDNSREVHALGFAKQLNLQCN